MSFLKTSATSTTVSSAGDSRQNLLQWPQRPARTARISNPYDLFLNICSILLVLTIVVYIILLLACNGRATKDIPTTESFLRQFSILSPTAMPILFAFIVGRAIKTVAHWRLHHGERIGMLDLLYGSTTVVNTITTIFDYGEFGFVAPLLIVVWALSPLGAQSALRVLSFRDGSLPSFESFEYLNMSTTFPQQFITADFGAFSAPVIALFLSSIGAPDDIKQSSLDTWGNIKVPVIELLPGYNGRISKEWISINRTENVTDLTTYSSLIGIPVAGVPKNENSTFTIETSYMNLNCDILEKAKDYNKTSYDIKGMTDDCNLFGNSSCSRQLSWGQLATIPFPEGYTNDSLPRCSNPDPSAREMIYLGWDSEGGGSYAECTMNTTYVELQVECVGWGCVSTAIRPSSLATNRGVNHTIFDGDCDNTVQSFIYLIQLLDQVTQMQSTRLIDASIVQSYLYDPSNALNSTALYTQPGVYTVGKSTFALRMAQILNSYWLATVAANALFLGHPSNYDALAESLATEVLSPMNFSNANATVFSPVIKIRCDIGWVVPLILSTLLMWTASMVTMAVDLQLSAPKMLMNLTSMTRGNPNFNLPPGGGGLTDETRGKLIKGLKVRFGRVEGNDPDDLVVGACIESGGTVSVARKHTPSIQDNVI